MRRTHARSRRGVVALLALSLVAAPALLAADSGVIAGRVRASPLTVSLDLSALSAPVGHSIQARATVSNIGLSSVQGIEVALRVDPVGLRVNKTAVKIAQLKAGKSVTVSWSVCGRLPGTYVLLARVTTGGVSIDSPARVLTVTPANRKVCA